MADFRLVLSDPLAYMEQKRRERKRRGSNIGVDSISARANKAVAMGMTLQEYDAMMEGGGQDLADIKRMQDIQESAAAFPLEQRKRELDIEKGELDIVGKQREIYKKELDIAHLILDEAQEVIRSETMSNVAKDILVKEIGSYLNNFSPEMRRILEIDRSGQMFGSQVKVIEFKKTYGERPIAPEGGFENLDEKADFLWSREMWDRNYAKNTGTEHVPKNRFALGDENNSLAIRTESGEWAIVPQGEMVEKAAAITGKSVPEILASNGIVDTGNERTIIIGNMIQKQKEQLDAYNLSYSWTNKGEQMSSRAAGNKSDLTVPDSTMKIFRSIMTGGLTEKDPSYLFWKSIEDKLKTQKGFTAEKATIALNNYVQDPNWQFVVKDLKDNIQLRQVYDDEGFWQINDTYQMIDSSFGIYIVPRGTYVKFKDKSGKEMIYIQASNGELWTYTTGFSGFTSTSLTELLASGYLF